MNWLNDCVTAAREAAEAGAYIHVEPIYTGFSLLLHYSVRDGVMQRCAPFCKPEFEGFVKKYSVLPKSTFVGNAVTKIIVSGKICSLHNVNAKRRVAFVALNVEAYPKQKKVLPHLLKLNLLYDRGFKTPLPLSTFAAPSETDSAWFRAHFLHVQNTVKNFHRSIWTETQGAYHPMPVGLKVIQNGYC